jgi:hypothetical protein
MEHRPDQGLRVQEKGFRRNQVMRDYGQETRPGHGGGRSEEQILGEFIHSLAVVDRNIFVLFQTNLSYQEIAQLAGIFEMTLRAPRASLRHHRPDAKNEQARRPVALRAPGPDKGFSRGHSLPGLRADLCHRQPGAAASDGGLSAGAGGHGRVEPAGQSAGKMRSAEEKSRKVDLTQGGSFGFLGFEFRRIRSRRGRWMPLRMPKGKKRTALLRKLKAVFRSHRSRPVRGLIAAINPIIRGWVNYFAVGNSSRCFSYIRSWVEKKVRRHLARACQREGFGWKRWNRKWIYGTLGLFNEYRVSW